MVEMDIKEIRSLIKMIMETDISEFELESTDEKIRIKRGEAHEVVHYQGGQQSPVAVPVPLYQAPVPDLGSASAEAPAPSAEKGRQITSPIVGTFYRAPAPDAAPYVEVGHVVEKGQVLCIIEAMKLMNEIEAEFRGTILRICKENAQPVEFGDVLFVVEPL